MQHALLFGDSTRYKALRDALASRGLEVLRYTENDAKEQAAWADLVVCLLPPPSEAAQRSITELKDWEAAARTYDEIACDFLRTIHGLLPSLRKDVRIAIWTHADASINQSNDTGDFARRMSLAAVNMAAVLMFHELRSSGYSMRICAAKDADYTADCFLRNRSYEPDNLLHSDEERLSMRGEWGMEMPW